MKNKVTVEIVYDDKSRNRRVVVEINGRLRATLMLDAIEDAVEKELSNDPDWKRWSLIDISESL